jgi:hypothetical protein
MFYLQVTESAIVKAPNHKSLMHAWRTYGGPLTLVGRFVVEKPLTEAQLRRLPADLRDKMA